MVHDSSEKLIQSAVALTIGGSSALLLYALRHNALALHQRHSRKLSDARALFTPEPLNAPRVVMLVYAGYGLALAALIWMTPAIVIGLGLWAALLVLPGVTLDYALLYRRKRIDQQLPQAISTLANCVRSGLTLVQGIARVARTAPAPVNSEFQIMSNRYLHGANLEQTVNEAKERLRLESFNLFASAILVNREMGGDVVSTLDRIAQSLVKLSQMRRTVEVHTAEGRMNIKILVAAPVLMLLLLSTVDSEGVGLLFTTPQGWAVLIVAGLLIGFGAFWATRIIRAPI